jgi:hypothetical protein
MPIQRYKPEQIVTMLRQIEVGIANATNSPQACKEATITVPDVLPLAQRIRRIEDGPGQAAERTGKGKRQAETAGGGAVVGGDVGSMRKNWRLSSSLRSKAH